MCCSNDRDQRLAEKAFQKRPACSRVRCIASLAITSHHLPGYCSTGIAGLKKEGEEEAVPRN
jgi:hypothetical protein